MSEDGDFEERLDRGLRRMRALTWAQRVVAFAPEPACPGCGRCVLAGPPCCDVAAERARAGYQEYLRDRSREVSARQAARRAAKVAKRAAYEARVKGVSSSDG